MEILELEENSKAWEDFLQKNESQIFHTPEWGIFVKKTFPSARHVCLAAFDHGEIQLIFPFTEIRSRLFGRKLISCAFVDYGGPAGNMDFFGKVIDDVGRRYVQSFGYLEMHRGLGDFGESMEKFGLSKSVGGRRFITRLGNTEELWIKISKQKRKAVRKAEESGLKVREIERKELENIYKLYLKGMREFGSPPYPLSFFENFYSIFVEKGLGRVLGTYHNDELVALLMGYTYRKRIHIIINVSDKRYLETRPNDILHWEFIKWGCENGYQAFDWGRSRISVASPPNFFKRMWATEEEDFPHYYLLWKSKKIPNVDPEGPKYKLFTKAWKRMPVTLTAAAGGRIRQGLGI